ncbi:MAG: nitrogen fixation protein FixH [Rhodobacteraceae bacterium GWE1_64_9]|nr:MAG: nitrogen fixation protein FixH [Rhodobacteraceae bacterium GWE1_64_9]OHC51134.1 MAG: nitrogen fixation protein FixH [Rhodobacteraceae bacterium GWF1_65_7]HBD91142.1 nitrogen fixation protein FixH [Gemmobacter sp.]
MGQITGRQVFAFTAGAFGIIIAVNVLMAYKAVSTFPGLEVKNSYVASQNFDTERRAQEALGWDMVPEYDPAGVLILKFTDAAGLPVSLGDLSVLVGRSTSAAEDTRPQFVHEGGLYTASITLAPGQWMLKVEARAKDGTLFQQRVDLNIRG